MSTSSHVMLQTAVFGDSHVFCESPLLCECGRVGGSEPQGCCSRFLFDSSGRRHVRADGTRAPEQQKAPIGWITGNYRHLSVLDIRTVEKVEV